MVPSDTYSMAPMQNGSIRLFIIANSPKNRCSMAPKAPAIVARLRALHDVQILYPCLVSTAKAPSLRTRS